MAGPFSHFLSDLNTARKLKAKAGWPTMGWIGYMSQLVDRDDMISTIGIRRWLSTPTTGKRLSTHTACMLKEMQ